MFVSLLIFKLTLFFLFSIVIMMLFKSQISPYLNQYINNLKEEWKNLNYKMSLTCEIKLKVEGEIGDQAQKLQDVELKIKKWNKSFMEQEKNYKLEQEEIYKKVAARKNIQKKQLHLIKLEQEVIPKAVALAHKELQQKEKESAVVLKNLIKKLEEKIVN